MDLRTTRFILSVTFLVVVIAMTLGTFLDAPGLTYVMMGFLGVFVTVYLIFLRCPNCKKHIGKMSNRKCKHCGQDLN